MEGNYLEAIDQVFGIHLDSSVPVGKLIATKGATNASCDIFKIEVSGQSSHVAQPQNRPRCCFSSYQYRCGITKIVAREIDPLDSVVVGIGVLQAGTRYNIVANQATIEGTVRTFSQETRQFVLQRVEEIAHEIAQSHRTEIADFSVYAAANPLINEEQATNRAQQVASEIVGFENVVTDHPKSLGADDFADYLAVIPGIYGRVGSRNLKILLLILDTIMNNLILMNVPYFSSRVPRTLCIKLFIRIIGIGADKMIVCGLLSL